MSEVLFPDCNAQRSLSACSFFGFHVYDFMERCYIWGFMGSVLLVPVGFVTMIIGTMVER